jgi:hypothetical protein
VNQKPNQTNKRLGSEAAGDQDLQASNTATPELNDKSCSLAIQARDQGCMTDALVLQ